MSAAPQRAAGVEWIPPGSFDAVPAAQLNSHRPARADRLVSSLVLLLLVGCVVVAMYDLWLFVIELL